MITFAQNGEDVVLARLFDGPSGFYVDLGAGHPLFDSVTKHFSERGWRGLNVEPLADEHAALSADRPGDINVRAAVTDHSGTVTLFVAPPACRGRSTIEEPLVASADLDEPFEPIEVPAVRLDEVLAEHGVDRIDFLKIDVEGAEAAIINSCDWSSIQPRVLLVEATRPGSPEPSHEDWEPTLIAAGYRCALFDGLNRFYAKADDAEAMEALAAPANAHDGAQPYLWLQRVADLEDRLAAQTDARSRAETYASSLEAERAATIEPLASVARELHHLAELGRELTRQADPGRTVIPSER